MQSPINDSARRALAAAVQPSTVHANPQEALWSVHPGARNALWSGLPASYRQAVERLLDDDQYDELATFATQPNTVVLVEPFMDLFQYLGDAREQRRSFFKALRNFSTAIVEVKLKAIIDEARYEQWVIGNPVSREEVDPARLKGRGTTYLAPPLEMLSFIFKACPNKDYLLPGLVGIERVFKGEARGASLSAPALFPATDATPTPPDAPRPRFNHVDGARIHNFAVFKKGEVFVPVCISDNYRFNRRLALLLNHGFQRIDEGEVGEKINNRLIPWQEIKRCLASHKATRRMRDVMDGTNIFVWRVEKECALTSHKQHFDAATWEWAKRLFAAIVGPSSVPAHTRDRDPAYVPDKAAEVVRDEERRLKKLRRKNERKEKREEKRKRREEKMARKKELKEKRMETAAAPPSPSPSPSDGYTTIIIDDTAVPAILSPIQDPPSPASSDSEDDEPVTVLMSPVHDPPSAATRPDPTRYVAPKKMPSPASSDSEDDEPAPSHLPVPPPLLVSLPLSPPTPPTAGVPDEMPSDEAVTAALQTFLLGSSVGAEVEVGGDEFAEAAGMVDVIVERLADPPTPSAPSAPSAPRKRKSEEKRRERKAGKGASSKLKRR